MAADAGREAAQYAVAGQENMLPAAPEIAPDAKREVHYRFDTKQS
jgi:hypothetical protein